MIKYGNIILITLIFTATSLLSFKYSEDFVNEAFPQGAAIQMPDAVKSIIKNKCYDCHNSSSKSKKGKMKLNFDKLNSLKVYKQVAKMESISESVTEGDMPPKKAIAKNPNLKLTEQEIKILVKWADGYVKELSGE